MRAVLLVVLVGSVGCGVDGQMMLDLDMDAGRSDAEMSPSPDTAGQQPDTTAGRQPDTSTVKTDTAAPDRMPGQTPDTGGSTAPFCAQSNDTHYSGCGLLEADYTWRSKWKDGYACAVCTYQQAQVTGCTVIKREGTKVEGDGPVLCVQVCGDCCWRKPSSSCDTDADCCSPLRCVAGEPGKNKTCQ